MGFIEESEDGTRVRLVQNVSQCQDCVNIWVTQ
jgi:hypothetical protein